MVFQDRWLPMAVVSQDNIAIVINGNDSSIYTSTQIKDATKLGVNSEIQISREIPKTELIFRKSHFERCSKYFFFTFFALLPDILQQHLLTVLNIFINRLLY